MPADLIDLTPESAQQLMLTYWEQENRRTARRLLVFRVCLSALCGLIGYVIGRVLP